MSKYKIGDKVRIFHTGHDGVLLGVNIVHEDVRAGYESVFLSGEGICFYDNEVDLVDKAIATMVKSRMDECTAAGRCQAAVGGASIHELVKTMDALTQNPPT